MVYARCVFVLAVCPLGLSAAGNFGWARYFSKPLALREYSCSFSHDTFRLIGMYCLRCSISRNQSETRASFRDTLFPVCRGIPQSKSLTQIICTSVILYVNPQLFHTEIPTVHCLCLNKNVIWTFCSSHMYLSLSGDMVFAITY